MKNSNSTNNQPDSAKKMLLFQRTAAVLVCAALLAAFLFCYFKYSKQIYEIFGDPESVKTFLGQFNGFDKLVFVAIRAFQTVIKIIPAEPFEIVSGILYGTWGGMLLCMAGTLLGSVVIIALTKAFGRRLVSLFVPVEKIDSLKFLQNEKSVYFTLFLIFLIPGTPKDIITYVAGLTKLDMKKFMLVTGIARIPSILVSTWCGEQIINQNYKIAITVFAATLIVTAAFSLIYKKVSSAKTKKAEADGKESEIEPDIKQ